MRQRITIEELRDIEGAELETFTQWRVKNAYIFEGEAMASNLPTIGELIHFIEDNDKEALQIIISRQIRGDGEKINLEKYYVSRLYKGRLSRNSGRKNSLIGNLWETTKGILNPSLTFVKTKVIDPFLN